jgi:transposase
MKTAYLGIDVSKGYADFVLIDQDLNSLTEPIQFDDTRDGHQSCKRWLINCIKSYKLTQIRAAVESTGGLENNWIASFKTLLPGFDLKMIRLNPASVKFASKASLSTVTTDGESAFHIAQYVGRYGQTLDFNAPENPYAAHKKVLMQLKHFTKMNTASKNVFRQLLYEIFPESQALFGQTIPSWLMEVLKKYPSPTRLARAKPSVVAKIKGMTEQKVYQMIALARTSIGSAHSETTEYIIRNQLRQLTHEQTQIKELKAYLERTVIGPEIDLLTSITGVGVYSAAVLMIQIGDITRFSSPQKLASFFGLTPVIRQSGDKKGASTMSKKGSSLVRATLYMCAKSAAIHDPHMKRIFDKHKNKGAGYNQALGVIMHKLIRIVWGILTTKTAYNPVIDQQNQQKASSSPQLQKDHEWRNKRREQAFDPMAPISSYAKKKRKEHLLSQAVKNGQVRDPESAPSGGEK